MEEARKKVKVCLILIVALAVVIGMIYYFRDVKGKEAVTDGTLVYQEEEAGICQG